MPRQQPICCSEQKVLLERVACLLLAHYSEGVLKASNRQATERPDYLTYDMTLMVLIDGSVSLSVREPADRLRVEYP